MIFNEDVFVNISPSYTSKIHIDKKMKAFDRIPSLIGWMKPGLGERSLHSFE